MKQICKKGFPDVDSKMHQNVTFSIIFWTKDEFL